MTQTEYATPTVAEFMDLAGFAGLVPGGTYADQTGLTVQRFYGGVEVMYVSSVRFGLLFEVRLQGADSCAANADRTRCYSALTAVIVAKALRDFREDPLLKYNRKEQG